MSTTSQHYVTTIACFDCGGYTVDESPCEHCGSENVHSV